MIRPEDLSLAEALLRSGKVSPDQIEKHLASLAGASGRSLGQALEESGILPKSELAAFSATMAPGSKLGNTQTLIPGSIVPPVAPAAPQPVPTAGGRKFGRYEILEEIARGGMGIVYRAFEPTLNRRVALKVMLVGEGAPPESLERFLREARSAAALHHPSIVQVLDVGKEAGQHFFAMELVDGDSLDQRLKAEGALPARTALRIALEAARALQYAHEKGVIHRDVKPGNILLGKTGADTSIERSLDGEARPFRVMLTDFGLAKDLGGGSSLTMTGSLIGTPAYMSPEQAAGSISKIDARSDVYSLGAVLYEALTGAPPFPGDTLAQVLSDIRSVEAVSVRKIKPELHRDVELIVHKAIAKEPERRYATAADFADDIERYLNGEAVSAAAPTIRYKVARFVRRRRAAVISGAVSLVALAAVGGWLGWRALRDRHDRIVRAEADLAERRRTAEANVAAGRKLLAGGDEDGAIVQAGLAESAVPGMPEAAVLARDARLAKVLRTGNSLAVKENWSGLDVILGSAAEFRDDPGVKQLSRLARGTCTLEAVSAEPDIEVDIGAPELNVLWTEENFPSLEEARSLGICRTLGRAPVASQDIAYGEWLVIFSRNGRAVRIVPSRLARSSNLSFEYRTFRVGSGASATHRELGDAIAAARPGAVIELMDGHHSFPDPLDRPGILFRPVAGARPVIVDNGRGRPTLKAIRAHGIALRGLLFDPLPKQALYIAGAFRPEITGCTFPGGGTPTLLMRDCDDWLVRDSTFENSAKTSFQSQDGKGGLLLRVASRGCEGDAFVLKGPKIRVVRCVVENAHGTGILLEGEGKIVTGCRVSASTDTGIYLREAGGSLVEDNVILDACVRPQEGVAGCLCLMSAGPALIHHNVVLGGGHIGLAVIMTDCEASGNIVEDVKGRGFHYHGNQFTPGGAELPITFDWLLTVRCKIFGRLWAVEYPTSADLRADSSYGTQNKFGPLQHCIEEPAIFVDRAAGDLHLVEASPGHRAAPDGLDYGPRFELLAADDALSSSEWISRANGDVWARSGLDLLLRPDRPAAQRAAGLAERFFPANPVLGKLKDRLK